MKKLFKVLPPSMPNYVRFEKEAQLRQDGFKVDNGLDIASFTEQEANEYADLMHKTFIEHWRLRKSKLENI